MKNVVNVINELIKLLVLLSSLSTMLLYNILLCLFLEVLRITKNEEVHHDDRRGGESSNQFDEPNRKPKYRSYSGGIVTEEIVKLSEKVVVPVKEYPKVGQSVELIYLNVTSRKLNFGGHILPYFYLRNTILCGFFASS